MFRIVPHSEGKTSGRYSPNTTGSKAFSRVEIPGSLARLDSEEFSSGIALVTLLHITSGNPEFWELIHLVRQARRTVGTIAAQCSLHRRLLEPDLCGPPAFAAEGVPTASLRLVRRHPSRWPDLGRANHFSARPRSRTAPTPPERGLAGQGFRPDPCWRTVPLASSVPRSGQRAVLRGPFSSGTTPPPACCTLPCTPPDL